jgi:cytochrome bd-type quinol oxidase subunit 2
MRELIDKNSNGKRVLLLFVFTNIVYALMLALTIPKVMQFTDGMKLLDMLPSGYDFGYVVTLFNALGEDGRHAYLCYQIPLDMIYPALFGISYCLLLAFFLKKLNRLNNSGFYLCLLPLIGAIADYLENIGIITMLNQYPNITPSTVQTTNLFSLVKSTSTSIYFVVLLIVLVILGMKQFKSKRKLNGKR